MGSGRGGGSIVQVAPQDAWDILASKEPVHLIDVRSKAEWAFVGLPDLSALDRDVICVEWASFPNMERNPNFAEEVETALGAELPAKVMFLCRSGVRSDNAAAMMKSHFSAMGKDIMCMNVIGGFEGDKDANGHRGETNGWKKCGLAWRQS